MSQTLSATFNASFTSAFNLSIRTAMAAMVAAALVVGTVQPAAAQAPGEARAADTSATPSSTSTAKWGFLVTSGTVVPTGVQRDVLKRANLTAGQVSYRIRPSIALSATLGWARSRDLRAGGDAKLDIFTYDFGAEVRTRPLMSGHRVTFSPFAGGGAGARSYNHRDLPIDATHDIAAYLGAGGELGVGRVRLRLEVRDYLTGFAPLGRGRTRNDVVVMTGLRLGIR